jgi:hypothetical protein
MLKKLLLCAFMVFISGCTTLGVTSPKYALVIRNVDWPLQDLSALVAYELPTGLRTTSPNGREFYSKYFVLDGNKYKLAGDATDRYTATATVLGDSRPYDIEIFVTHEKRVLRASGFDYVEVGHDMMLARELEFKLKSELAKHREDRNIIDDFRVF